MFKTRRSDLTKVPPREHYAEDRARLGSSMHQVTDGAEVGRESAIGAMAVSMNVRAQRRSRRRFRRYQSPGDWLSLRDGWALDVNHPTNI
jgi:hypothetical protein